MKTLAVSLALVAVVTFAAKANSAGSCDALDVSLATESAAPQNIVALRHIASLDQRLPQRVDILLIGDSLAQYWPASSLAQIFPGKRVLNLGVSDNTTENTLWQLDQLAGRAPKARVAIVFIGTNNLFKNDEPCAIAAGVDRVLEKIADIFHSSQTIYVAIPPRNLQGDTRNANRLSAIAAVQAQHPEDATIVDLDRQLACASSGTCDVYVSDHLHLKPNGYAMIGPIIASTVWK